jgi:hypothetical protein
VTEHLDDLEADFLAIYGIEDMYDLTGPKFLALAYRVSAYQGVMRLRAHEVHEEPEPDLDSYSTAAPGDRVVASTRLGLEMAGFEIEYESV